jgi:hypothetical protein
MGALPGASVNRHLALPARRVEVAGESLQHSGDVAEKLVRDVQLLEDSSLFCHVRPS